MKMFSRKEFLIGASAGLAFPQMTFAEKPSEIRAILLHLGHNWACEWFPDDFDMSELKDKYKVDMLPDKKLRTSDENWRRVMDYIVKSGKVNMVVIDLLEGVVYPSHPELAIEDSWSPEKLKAEIKRLNALGIEVIPKLNFSTTHNGWLKQYRRMLSTPKYYQVCDDLIRDVCEIFDHPRFFHIGCDEETVTHQDNARRQLYLSVRKNEFWKYDFLKLVGTVEKYDMRAWAWNDYGWHHPEFYEWCPKSVMMNSWYYDESAGGFEIGDYKAKTGKEILQAYYELDKRGFDQVPCGSNYIGWGRRQKKMTGDDVIGKLIATMRRDLKSEHLKGFMMAPWCCANDEEHIKKIFRAVDLFAAAI